MTAQEMIDGYKQLIQEAHDRGIEVYLFTRTAWKGYTRNVPGGGTDVEWTPEIDQMRQDINTWIRSEDNPADGCIDLDFMCADEGATEPQKRIYNRRSTFYRSGTAGCSGCHAPGIFSIIGSLLRR